MSIDELRRFLLDPAGELLRQLGVHLAPVAETGADLEPLAAPDGLDRHLLQRAVFDGLLGGQDDDSMYHVLRARGLMPSGAH